MPSITTLSPYPLTRRTTPPCYGRSEVMLPTVGGAHWVRDLLSSDIPKFTTWIYGSNVPVRCAATQRLPTQVD